MSATAPPERMTAPASAPALAPAPRPAVARNWLLAGVAVIAAFLALGLLAEAFAPAPQGPTGSSFATSPGGAAAWAQLVRRTGHPVFQLRRPLSEASLPPQAAVVVLDAPALSSAAAANLNRFVQSGGRLIVAGGNLATTLPALLARPPQFTSRGSPFAHAASIQPEVAGVTTVRTGGAGAFTGGAGTTALATPTGALLVTITEGNGRIDLLADPSPVENELLATADNAQLALNLAGAPHRPVVFAEALHGYTEATGLAAIPTRWWIAFGGLGLAAACWALSRGRRLGPPEPPAPDPAPPRSAYVDALATALIKADDKP